MKTIYRCRECGEDYKQESPQANVSNIGTGYELIYHLDPCPNCCNDNAECDRIFELEQDNKALKAKLHTTEEGISRLGEFIAKQNRSKAALKNILAFDFDREIYTLADWTGFEIYTAPTMPDLIDAILTGGK